MVFASSPPFLFYSPACFCFVASCIPCLLLCAPCVICKVVWCVVVAYGGVFVCIVLGVVWYVFAVGVVCSVLVCELCVWVVLWLEEGRDVSVLLRSGIRVS